MEQKLKQGMKKLANNRGLSGFKSMDVGDLEYLLTSNVNGFELVRDIDRSTITISWLKDEKRVGIIYSIDWPEGEILEDDF
jgi:hypothetical protein